MIYDYLQIFQAVIDRFYGNYYIFSKKNLSYFGFKIVLLLCFIIITFHFHFQFFVFIIVNFVRFCYYKIM